MPVYLLVYQSSSLIVGKQITSQPSCRALLQSSIQQAILWYLSASKWEAELAQTACTDPTRLCLLDEIRTFVLWQTLSFESFSLPLILLSLSLYTRTFSSPTLGNELDCENSLEESEVHELTLAIGRDLAVRGVTADDIRGKHNLRLLLRKDTVSEGE